MFILALVTQTANDPTQRDRSLFSGLFDIEIGFLPYVDTTRNGRDHPLIAIRAAAVVQTSGVPTQTNQVTILTLVAAGRAYQSISMGQCLGV